MLNGTDLMKEGELLVCVECFLSTGKISGVAEHDHEPWVHFRADLYKAPYIAKCKEIDLWNIKYCHPEKTKRGNWLFTQNRNGENDTLTLSLLDKGIWVWQIEKELDHATSGRFVNIKWPD
jgi:hypothetical protein